MTSKKRSGIACTRENLKDALGKSRSFKERRNCERAEGALFGRFQD
jgi:hypothetical protein